ncbi:MAG: hypothetical protein KBS52_02610 [Clostridiales bacterium]|nr:hypothetical protein [Candidatus Equinaster intestinalis]
MKRIISAVALLLCLSLLFCSCKDSGETKNGENKAAQVPGGYTNTVNLIPGGSIIRNRSEFKVPDNLITTEEYQKELDSISKSAENFSDITDEIQKRLDNLDLKLQEQIVYNTDDITECEGAHYYLSAEGDDTASGTSPETAWQSIKKLNSVKLTPGDLVSFRRGDKFRGVVHVTSGVTFGAYGTGYKPQILGAFDGTQWDWIPTETPNVWKLDHRFGNKDLREFPNNDADKLTLDLSIAVLVKPDGTEINGIRSSYLAKLDKNYKFCYLGPNYNNSHSDTDGGKTAGNHIYLYCEDGDPNEVFTDIEIGVNLSVFNEKNLYIEDVHLNNLEILYGRGPFWPGDCKNISVTYCIAGWQGGFDDGSQGTPYGGGGGVWGNCEGFLWDHCYIFQQWDSGVSPQYNGSSNPVKHFYDFNTTNCLFKGCKWTLEYWLYQKLTTEDIIKNLKFDYNICRDGGKGFNPNKRMESAYVMTWGYESTCYDSSISHNVFDRPYALTYEIGGFEQLEAGTDVKSPVDKFSIERMPTMEGNIHIQIQGKKFATVHKGCEYKDSSHDLLLKYKKEDLQSFIDQGFEKNSLFLFAPKEDK